MFLQVLLTAYLWKAFVSFVNAYTDETDFERALAGGYGGGYLLAEAHKSRYRLEYATAVMGAGIGAALGVFVGSKGEVIYKSP